MDIICPIDGEPWDFDSLHEEAAESGRTYTEVMRDFQQRGCVALETAFGPMRCERDESSAYRAMVAEAMYDLCGDDMDGAASMMEDFL